MSDTYKTITSPSEGSFKDKGSKFLAFAYPVGSDEEVKEHVTTLKKKFHDARHHCYAYRINPENQIYRVNDDGEPSGTAGKPIYGQILSNELFNILIIVVRYFGGTLLGTSGLINAYKNAALDCIKNANIIERTIDCRFVINFPFVKMNQIMRIIKEEEINIISQKFEMNCNMDLSVRKNKLKKVIDRFEKIEDIQVESKIL